MPTIFGSWSGPRATLGGIYRTHRRRTRQAAAPTSAELKRLATACGGGLTGLRDCALLLLGFAGALRHSELVAVDREHIRLTETGLRLLLPSSKTNAEGKGIELSSRGSKAGHSPASGTTKTQRSRYRVRN